MYIPKPLQSAKFLLALLLIFSSKAQSSEDEVSGNRNLSEWISNNSNPFSGSDDNPLQRDQLSLEPLISKLRSAQDDMKNNTLEYNNKFKEMLQSIASKCPQEYSNVRKLLNDLSEDNDFYYRMQGRCQTVVALMLSVLEDETLMKVSPDFVEALCKDDPRLLLTLLPVLQANDSESRQRALMDVTSLIFEDPNNSQDNNYTPPIIASVCAVGGGVLGFIGGVVYSSKAKNSSTPKEQVGASSPSSTFFEEG